MKLVFMRLAVLLSWMIIALGDKASNDELVRILIKTDGFSGIYHSEIVLASNEPILAVADDGSIMYYPAASALKFDTTSTYAQLRISTIGNEGITITNLKRNCEATYRGTLELLFADEGIVVINEIDIEQYLYAVVPSEMPTSYPLEALKAQAVCARTYTYMNMTGYAYPLYSVHMDDSTSYQVYMNNLPDENAIRAVDETAGKVMMDEGELLECMYYSTSGDNITSYDDMGKASDIEYNTAWYRWNFDIDIDAKATDRLLCKIYELFASNSENIEIISDKKSPKDLVNETNLSEITVLNREDNYQVTSLMVKTPNFKITIKTQYTIRLVLGALGGEVVRKDGSVYKISTMLPSAFIYIKTQSEKSKITGISIHGAGFGHGVGMAQNGALGLAQKGMTYEEILGYYYSGADIVSSADLSF